MLIYNYLFPVKEGNPPISKLIKSNKIKSFLYKISLIYNAFILSYCNNIYAASSSTALDGGYGASKDTSEGILLILGIVLKIGHYIGVLLLIWGGGKYGLAIKDSDANGKTTAATIMGAAIALITLRKALQTIGIIT